MWDETAKVIEVIWVRMESEYFCKWDWTRGANHVEPSQQIVATAHLAALELA
jgi:hypothetical protein